MRITFHDIIGCLPWLTTVGLNVQRFFRKTEREDGGRRGNFDPFIVRTKHNQLNWFVLPRFKLQQYLSARSAARGRSELFVIFLMSYYGQLHYFFFRML